MITHPPRAWHGQAAYTGKRSWSGLAVVAALHLLLAWGIASGLARRVVEVVRAPIQTVLVDEKPAEPPPPERLPSPPKTMPPTTQPMPVPDVAPPPVAAVVPAAPAPAPAPVPVQAPPPPPREVVEAVRPPPPAAAPVRTAPARSVEDGYLGELRAYLNSIKRYPTSREARQLRPQGTVRLWIEIDRGGQLLGAGVEGSSGSLLLDNEALRTVRNGRFPPMPAEAYAGQPSHRFVMSMEYVLEGS